MVIYPYPIIIQVETFSGRDVAEERAREIFRYKYTKGEIPLYNADHSDAEVMEAK